MASDFKDHINTKAVHAGWTFDPANGALMPPIYWNSTYAQTSPGHPISHYEYSRTANPTRDVLEASLAALENGQHGLAFASGCAALSTLLQTFPKDTHVITNDDLYGGTHRLIAQVFSAMGFSLSMTDLSDPRILNTLKTSQTRLIWIETPSNPLLKLTDIQKVVAWRNQHAPEVMIAVDNTFATPVLQNPLDLGADLVCHSTTKYIGGHSDVIGGALITNNAAIAEKLRYLQNAVGAVPSPMDCFLLLRSIKTLPLRMAAHCQNALKIATFLESHPQVERVFYPGLPSHPNYDLAKKQMRGFGGMISVELKGDLDQIAQFLKRLRLFSLAESLGGVESLIESPALMTHAAIPEKLREKIGLKAGLVRISVGIEDPDDLIADLKQALAR